MPQVWLRQFIKGYWQLFGLLGTRDFESFGRQVLLTIFLYFNLKRNPTFKKNGCHSENNFLKKWNKKNWNSEPFCVLIKKGGYWEVATILLLIPFNELAWVWWLDREFWYSFDTVLLLHNSYTSNFKISQYVCFIQSMVNN